jgi:hypothetical protein
MSQVMKGQILGSPAGGAAICDLYGAGNPNDSTDPYVQNCAPGSTYRDYTGSGGFAPTFWFKTGLSGSETQAWQQVALP